MENNLLYSFDGLVNLENLRKLNLNSNEIFYSEDHHKNISLDEVNLPSRLIYLSLSHNKIASLKFLTAPSTNKQSFLIEFYASYNQIKNLRDIFHLKHLNALLILDLYGNPISSEANRHHYYRLFSVYHLKMIKSLDGKLIDQNEVTESKEQFGGKLTCDFIAERFNSAQNIKFNELKNLEFPQSSLRIVDLSGAHFDQLRSLNLENNNLNSFSGIIHLKSLKVLCLNYNKIESILPKSKATANITYIEQSCQTSAADDVNIILPHLEILHLAYNGISDLVALQIGKLKSLRALFLQGMFFCFVCFLPIYKKKTKTFLFIFIKAMR
jgi:Leucine-rich repeat (LRR) protein